MGTNYYLICIRQRTRRGKTKRIRRKCQIHVGKSSIGWPFIFSINLVKQLDPKFYQSMMDGHTTRADIKLFFQQLINSKIYKLMDEYGVYRDFDKLWELILIKNQNPECIKNMVEHMNQYKNRDIVVDELYFSLHNFS